MTEQREQRIKQTLINLIELFREEDGILSEKTEELVVRAFEGLRWDLRCRIPDGLFWDEVDDLLRGMSRLQKRRFEGLVREMLLQEQPARRA